MNIIKFVKKIINIFNKLKGYIVRFKLMFLNFIMKSIELNEIKL